MYISLQQLYNYVHCVVYKRGPSTLLRIKVIKLCIISLYFVLLGPQIPGCYNSDNLKLFNLLPQISTSVTVSTAVVNCASTNREALSVAVTLVTSLSVKHNV